MKSPKILFAILVIALLAVGLGSALFDREPSEAPDIKKTLVRDKTPKPAPDTVELPDAPEVPIVKAKPKVAAPKSFGSGIRGRVLFGNSSKVIAKVEVWLEPSKHGRVLTDERGEFYIPAPAGQAKVLVAKARRFKPVSVNVVTSSHPKPTHLRLYPARCGRIEGYLRTKRARLEDYVITVNGEPHHFAAEDSSFIIEDVNVGTRLVCLARYGEKAPHFPIQQMVNVKENEASRVEFSLPRLSMVEGSVVGSDGEALAKAVLRFGRVKVMCDEKGHFRWGIPGQGRLRVTAYHKDYGYVAVQSVELVSGDQPSRFEFVLKRAGEATVEGRVLMKGQIPRVVKGLVRIHKGEGVKGGPPLLKRFAKSRFRHSNFYPCDEHGVFRIPYLAAGVYTVEAFVGTQRISQSISLKEKETIRLELDLK